MNPNKNDKTHYDIIPSTLIEKAKLHLTENMQKYSEEYDYIILTTRRCFCIYKAMMSEGLFIDYQNVYSSQKIDIIGDQFKDSNVLLIDDIMIHGTSVYDIYNRIFNEYGAKNVDTLVFVRNIEFPDYYEFKTKPYKSLTNEIEADWRNISNQLVEYVHNSNQLYISYIYGYILDKIILDRAISHSKNNLFETDIELFNTLSFKPFNPEKIPKIYIYTFKNDYSFINKASLRIYNCASDNQKQVLPYVELKDFNEDNLESIWISIWKDKTVPDELLSIRKPADKFKALTAICSLFMYRELFNPNDSISSLCLSTTKFIDKSFVDNFIEYVQKGIKDDALNIISKKYEDIAIDKFQHSLSKNGLKICENLSTELYNINLDNELETPTTIISTIIEKCIYKTSQDEEAAYKEGIKEISNEEGELEVSNKPVERIENISTNYLYNYKKLPLVISNIAYTIMLFFLDCGMISHTVKCVNGIVGTIVKTGEQSYHTFSDLLRNALRPIYELLSFINRLNQDYREKFVDALLKKLDSISSNSCLYKFKNVICYILEQKQINFRANYFGILEMRSKNVSEENFLEENKILDELNELIDSIL